MGGGWWGKREVSHIIIEYKLFYNLLDCFISFMNSGCELKDSQKNELSHCASQEPKWREDKEGCFSFRYFHNPA